MKKILLLGILPALLMLGGCAKKGGLPAGQNKYCGDGFCGPAERADRSLCLKDCSETADVLSADVPQNSEPNQAATAASSGTDGRFGFHAWNAGYDHVADIGTSWSREGLYVIWTSVDLGRNGGYRFKDATNPPKAGAPRSGGKVNYDEQWMNAPDGLNIMGNVCPFIRSGSFASGNEKAAYEKFVEKMVERYDGDADTGCTLKSPDCYNKGDGQYPSSEAISHYKKIPIKHWQLCNQLTDTCEGTACRTTYAKDYAEALKMTYGAVKKADSLSSVMIAGDSARDFYPAVYEELAGRYVDIIDFHRFGEHTWWKDAKNDLDFLRQSLKEAGFDLSKLRFWMTETGTYSGDTRLVRGKDLPYQDETEQAQGLVKAYVSGFSNGVEKIFWAWGVTEGFQRECSIFDYTGVIYDGCDCEEGKYVCKPGAGYDLGRGVKKLAYYSYKKMVEVLGNFDKAETVSSADTYIFKIYQGGRKVWVAWREDPGQAIIAGIDSKQVKITEAVPRHQTGKEVSSYSDAFRVRSEMIKDGKLAISLGQTPLYIEAE